MRSSLRRVRLAVGFVVVCLLASVTGGLAADEGGQVIERVIAVVDGEPIFLGELDEATGCLEDAGVSADQMTGLRILILRRIILTEAVRLRIVENVGSESDFSGVLWKYIDTTVRPFVGLHMPSVKQWSPAQGDNGGAEPEARLSVEGDDFLAPELLDELVLRVAELWEQRKIRVLPGPWGLDLTKPGRREVGCLLRANRLPTGLE